MAKSKKAPEGNPAEEAAESPAAEAAEQAAGQGDHPVVHRPHNANSPYPA